MYAEPPIEHRCLHRSQAATAEEVFNFVSRIGRASGAWPHSTQKQTHTHTHTNKQTKGQTKTPQALTPIHSRSSLLAARLPGLKEGIRGPCGVVVAQAVALRASACGRPEPGFVHAEFEHASAFSSSTVPGKVDDPLARWRPLRKDQLAGTRGPLRAPCEDFRVSELVSPEPRWE